VASAAAFASHKTSLFEKEVWHGWSGQTTVVTGSGQGLSYYDSARPGSVWFFDGHTELMHARDALTHVRRYPQWNVQPFGITAFGLHGRDK